MNLYLPSQCSPKLKSAPEKPLSASAAKLRLLKRLHCTLRFEKKVWQLGARFVAGVDEVGRGSLFGPVVAAAVILDPNYRIRGLRDSKLLPAERREVLAERIREHCDCLGDRGYRCRAHRSDQYLSGLAFGHAGRGAGPESRSRPLAGGRAATRLRTSAATDHSRRRPVRFDRRRIHFGQSRTRPHDRGMGPCFSRVRTGFEQRLQHASTSRGFARARAFSAASPVICSGVECAGARRMCWPSCSRTKMRHLIAPAFGKPDVWAGRRRSIEDTIPACRA